MAIVKLNNAHYGTDREREEGDKELQLLLGIARFWHDFLEPVREAFIREKCSDMMGVSDGAVGAVLNTLEQVDVEKLEAEVEEYFKQRDRIDFLSAPGEKWLKFRYGVGMEATLQAALDQVLEAADEVTVLFPSGEVAMGKLERRVLIRDGRSVVAWGVVVDNDDHDAWYDLMDVKIDRDSIPALSQ